MSADPSVFRATIKTLSAAGLDAAITTEGGMCTVLVSDLASGHRFVLQDVGPWVGLVQAAGQAGFDLEGCDARGFGGGRVS